MLQPEAAISQLSQALRDGPFSDCVHYRLVHATQNEEGLMRGALLGDGTWARH